MATAKHEDGMLKLTLPMKSATALQMITVQYSRRHPASPAKAVSTTSEVNMITTSLNTLPLSTHRRQYFPPDEQRQPCRVWVDEQGHILDCCANTQIIFGYDRDALKGRHIAVLIPSLGHVSLLDGGAVNPRLAYRCRCAVPFQVVDYDGRKSRCHLFMNRVTLPNGPALALICVPLLY